jgi:hypothetical protein
MELNEHRVDATQAPCDHGKMECAECDRYPCVKCGKLRTKAQGGTTFTVCDRCWEYER